MEGFKNQLLSIFNDEYSDEQLVSLFEVIAEKLELGTVKDIASRTGKSDRGIRTSSNYRKINVGSATLVCDKLRESIF